MNELLPIIRRVRRPLIEPDAKPVAPVEPAPPTPPPAAEVEPTESVLPEASNEADTDY